MSDLLDSEAKRFAGLGKLPDPRLTGMGVSRDETSSPISRNTLRKKE